MSNNPMVNETLVSKIKTKLKKDKKDEIQNIKAIEVYLLGMNNAMKICAEACACCWDKKIPDSYDDICEYVAKRSRIGHTSVLEHSNHIILLKIDNYYYNDLLEFMDTCNYLNTRLIKPIDSSDTYLILGGSYRAYADLYREAYDLNNPILKSITGNLYMYSHSAAFEDICRLNLMDKSMFMNVEPDENFYLLSKFDDVIDDDLFSIIGIDDISKLYTNIFNISQDIVEYIKLYDLIKFVTITILFKNMSRTCTHQLVRHRIAITQESQRYVDYSNACFSSPDMFKDRYDSEHLYPIRFGPASVTPMTLSSIGDAMCNIYNQLHSASVVGKDHALINEDARAFLPSNVQCKKIYTTFTYKKFLKFLDLREDKASQAEIRKYAIKLGEWFRNNSEFSTKELCDYYINPRLLVTESFNIDINESIEDTFVEITEEDYIKAAGLDIIDDE